MANPHPHCAARVRSYFDHPEGHARYRRLLSDADRMVRSKHWCVATADRHAPGGTGAVDVFGQVYVALLAGRRSFPDELPVDVGIRCIVRSLVDNLLHGFENTHRADHLAVAEDGTVTDHFDHARPFWDPTVEALSDEETRPAAARCVRFIEFCQGDDGLVALLTLIRDEGIDGPAKLVAQRLGISEFEVYNIRKRLITAVRKFERAAA